MTDLIAAGPRRLCALLAAVAVLLVLAGWCSPAGATVPFDHRSTAPNQSSELPGAGYLLTDPAQGPSRAYWAGAYRSVPGQRGYCIDDFYDYPNPSYRYRTVEVASWAGRPGSNLGARGHTAQRIIWIVNSFGQSREPATDAAVSMAINLLTGSAPFLHSYATWFRPQLAAINPAIVVLINRMVAESDRYAGPYRTVLRFGPVPPVGGSGTVRVSVLGARNVPVPGARYRVLATAGMVLGSGRSGSTGRSGVAVLRYRALRAGPASIAAQGVALPNTVMRLGYSPTHNTGNFRTGSQRVALVSAPRLRNVAASAARIAIAPPTIRTVVQAGTAGRLVGELVVDRVQASGLIPHASYLLTAGLQDATGSPCGSVTGSVRASAAGRLDLNTASVRVCGGGWNTFTERLIDRAGHLMVASPPGQPSETFPVLPSARTAVVGGTDPRRVGDPVRDRVIADGLAPVGLFQVQAILLDASGRACGSVTGSVHSDSHGRFDFQTAPVRACGRTRDSFTETVRDQAGAVLVTTPVGQPGETFPLTSPRAPVPAQSSQAVASPAHPSQPPARSRLVRSAPHLASTGARPELALTGGLLTLLVGTGLLRAGRRRS